MGMSEHDRWANELAISEREKFPDTFLHIDEAVEIVFKLQTKLAEAQARSIYIYKSYGRQYIFTHARRRKEAMNSTSPLAVAS